MARKLLILASREPIPDRLLEDTLTTSQCLDVGKGFPRCPPVPPDLEGQDGFLGIVRGKRAVSKADFSAGRLPPSDRGERIEETADNRNRLIELVGVSKKGAMHWWRSQLISRFPGRKIEMFPFLSVQRAVSGQV